MRSGIEEDCSPCEEDGLAGLLAVWSDDSPDAVIHRALSAAREYLDMEVAFVAEAAGDLLVFRWLEGDGESFGLRREAGTLLKETYCVRLLSGEFDGVVTDAARHRVVSQLDVTRTAGIGSYIGVPIGFSDGRVFGTLCCASHSPDESLSSRDLRFLRLLARLVADQLERRESEAKERCSHIRWIRRVLSGIGLNMAYQPIVDLESGTLIGVEALARFDLLPDRSVDAWFRDAWTVGYGVELELKALRSAFDQAHRLPGDCFLAVNISPEVLVSSAFATAVKSLPVERLVVEITEHSGVPDYDELERTVACLRAAGARLAVDDVGAGFANLSHVLRLAPEFIKLDVTLVRDIDTDRLREALASSLVAFSARMGSAIVAEGVETQRQVEALRVLGVSFGQGRYLGAPAALPLEA